MSILNTDKLLPTLTRNQNRVNELSNNITSGVRIHRPSDDPIAAARLLDVNTSISENAQYISNAESAGTMLSLQDTSLSQITDDLQNIREAVMAGMNATASPEQVKIQGLVVRSGFESLMNQANLKTPYGYMYSGFKEGAPYAESATTSTYSGDNNHRELRIGPSTTLRTTFTGEDVFRSSDPSNDMFALVKDISSKMATGSFTSADAQSWLNKIDNQIDHVVNIRAQAGVRGKTADDVVSRFSERTTALMQEKSNLEDTDIPSAMIELNNKKTAIQATYQTIASLGDISIFNYMR